MFNVIRRVYQNHNSIVRLCKAGISNEICKSEVLYESKFSLDEQASILRILNESPLEDLYKFDATKARLIKIDHWRTKRGPFKLLSDVLELEGFGIKVFEKLCYSILNNRANSLKPINKTESTKPRKAVVSPLIDPAIVDNIKNAVSIHLTPNGLSWCMLLRQGNSIQSWNMYNFDNLPKKLATCDLVHLAVVTLDKIPSADAYVFEAPMQATPQSKLKMMASSVHIQQMELYAMVIALLTTCPKHNAKLNFGKDAILPLLDFSSFNRVYFLRPLLSARLFDTLVGKEMVSTIATIEGLLKLKDSKADFPCSEVECNMELREYFSTQTSVNKHLLGQALLIIISFMDLCIYNNPNSVKSISSQKRKR